MRDNLKQLCSSLLPCAVLLVVFGLIGCAGVTAIRKQSLAARAQAESARIQAAAALAAITNRVPYVPPPRADYLTWDNPNPPELWAFMWIEVRETTNLSQPFRTVIWQPLGGSNRVYLPLTNAQAFRIARFAEVFGGGNRWVTNFSDWNTK